MKNPKLPRTAPTITYCMVCPQGQYVTKSWISLGWAVLTHRLWHLFKHGRWMD